MGASRPWLQESRCLVQEVRTLEGHGVVEPEGFAPHRASSLIISFVRAPLVRDTIISEPLGQHVAWPIGWFFHRASEHIGYVPDSIHVGGQLIDRFVEVISQPKLTATSDVHRFRIDLPNAATK